MRVLISRKQKWIRPNSKKGDIPGHSAKKAQREIPVGTRRPDMIFDELEEDEEETEKLFGAVPQSVEKAKHPKTPKKPAQR